MAFHQCEFYDTCCSHFVWMSQSGQMNHQCTLKLFPQSGQANSFSPVWIRRCLFDVRDSKCLNFLSHSTQTNSFSPVWIRIATICECLVAVRTNEWLTIERHSRLNNDKYLTMIRTQGRPQATWCPRQSSLVTWAVMCEKWASDLGLAPSFVGTLWIISFTLF